MLHALLLLATQDQLAGHPKVGASFEGSAIDQLSSCLALTNSHSVGHIPSLGEELSAVCA